tara:strand:+ start:211 stop:336 length:126 start_codon:yes stop_codon:yes gene_type:complete
MNDKEIEARRQFENWPKRTDDTYEALGLPRPDEAITDTQPE